MSDIRPSDNGNNIGAYTGAAKTAKYGYQTSRALQGLGTTTRLTAAVDILAGGMDAGHAESATALAKGLDSTTKGATGAAKISQFGKIAGYASKAAPVITKGSCVLGAAIGGYDIGSGIHNISQGNTQKGKEQIVGGTADVVTAGALAVAATSAGTVVGLPVAGVALGVAAGSQAVKYGYKYHDKIADGAKWAGGKIADGAKWAGEKAAHTGQHVGEGIVGGSKAAGKGIANGANFVADKASDGFSAVKDTAGHLKDGVSGAFNKLAGLI